jgi:hypothetical protein
VRPCQTLSLLHVVVGCVTGLLSSCGVNAVCYMPPMEAEYKLSRARDLRTLTQCMDAQTMSGCSPHVPASHLSCNTSSRPRILAPVAISFTRISCSLVQFMRPRHIKDSPLGLVESCHHPEGSNSISTMSSKYALTHCPWRAQTRLCKVNRCQSCSSQHNPARPPSLVNLVSSLCQGYRTTNLL